jgi:hypothetical protein
MLQWNPGPVLTGGSLNLKLKDFLNPLYRGLEIQFLMTTQIFKTLYAAIETEKRGLLTHEGFQCLNTV